jgi:transcriptional regulator of met regulon
MVKNRHVLCDNKEKQLMKDLNEIINNDLLCEQFEFSYLSQVHIQRSQTKKNSKLMKRRCLCHSFSRIDVIRRSKEKRYVEKSMI